MFYQIFNFPVAGNIVVTCFLFYQLVTMLRQFSSQWKGLLWLAPVANAGLILIFLSLSVPSFLLPISQVESSQGALWGVVIFSLYAFYYSQSRLKISTASPSALTSTNTKKRQQRVIAKLPFLGLVLGYTLMQNKDQFPTPLHTMQLRAMLLLGFMISLYLLSALRQQVPLPFRHYFTFWLLFFLQQMLGMLSFFFSSPPHLFHSIINLSLILTWGQVALLNLSFYFLFQSVNFFLVGHFIKSSLSKK